jgi:hypothetical protein
MVKTSLQQEHPTEEKKARNIPPFAANKHGVVLLLSTGAFPHHRDSVTFTAFILTIILLHFTRELIGKSMYNYAYSLSFRLRLYIRNCARLVGISSLSGSERGGNRMVIARRG